MFCLSLLLAMLYQWMAAQFSCALYRIGWPGPSQKRWKSSNLPARNARIAAPRRKGGAPKPQWVRLRALEPYAVGGLSYRQAQAAFTRLHADTGQSVSRNTVYNWVQRYLSEMRQVQQASKNAVPRAFAANQCWGPGWHWQSRCAWQAALHPRYDRLRHAPVPGAHRHARRNCCGHAAASFLGNEHLWQAAIDSHRQCTSL